MKTPHALKPLALSMALAALPAFPGAAQATPDWMRQCTAGYDGSGGGDLYCHQGFREGLAAVLTGSASDAEGRWGYIDKQGRMAIAPAYQDARPFQNGLAAASLDGLWGYIDGRGQWVIKPRFNEATGFNAEGTALAEEQGRDVLIDRSGTVIKTFELGTRSSGFLPGQKLASMEMPMPPRLFNAATGKAATLPAGVMALAAPSGGYLPAQLRDSRYGGWWGLLDDQARWAVAPDVLRAREAPLRDGDVLAVRRNEGWKFVDARGKAIHAQRYEHVQLAAPGLWLVKQKGAGKALLLNGKLGIQHAFTADYIGIQERGGWRFMIDDAAVLLIDPAGQFRKIDARHGGVEVNDGLAWVTASLAPQAVEMAADAAAAGAAAADAAATADAAAMAADAAAAGTAAVSGEDGPGEAVEASAQAASAPEAADAAAAADGATAETVAVDIATPASMDAASAAADAVAAAVEAASADAAADGGSLLQIYSRDGKPLLDAGTLARLQAYDLSVLAPSETARGRASAASLPLAVLRPLDGSPGLGILTAKGRIVTNPNWRDIRSHDAALPLPVHAANGKVGAIDGEGNWAIEPAFDNIRPFRGAYALAAMPRTGDDETLVIDARGKRATIPAAVLDGAREFDGDLIQYREPDENREYRWGIWNIRKGAPMLKPAYESMEKFEDDWARVEHQDRWGVINREGKWVVPATHDSSYDLQYLGNGFMLVEDASVKQRDRSYSGTAYRLINLRTGKASEPLTGKPDKLRDGRYLGELLDSGAVLFDTDGRATRISEGRPERKEVYQDWIYIEHEAREGAIDARGNMKVPARYGEFNPFFVQPEGLARVYAMPGYRVIDQDGKTVLPKHGDGTPLATMARIVFHDSDNSASIMTDLQGREITRVAGAYSVQDGSASEGVVPYRDDRGNGKSGFIDAAGKRIVGAHFDSLGPLKNGLAAARRLQYTGNQYGYIDLTGRYAIPPAFAWAGDFQEERALVRSKGHTQYIDTKGEPIATFVFVCDTVTILDGQGRITWPQQKMDCPVADKLELAAPDNAKAKQP